MDPLTLPAGEEMDALVAEKVMGWRIGSCQRMVMSNRMRKRMCGINGKGKLLPVPRFSTDIAAAWEVLLHVTKPLHGAKDGGWLFDRLGFRCCEHDEDGCHGEWRVEFGRASPEEWAIATADTAPLAICRAALAAAEKK